LITLSLKTKQAIEGGEMKDMVAIITFFNNGEASSTHLLDTFGGSVLSVLRLREKNRRELYSRKKYREQKRRA